jgi:DNA-binding winged helix-turn-helix (wHTH) protein
MTLVDDILALPQEDRLDAALNAIEDLTGTDTQRYAWLKSTYGLTTREADALQCLARRGAVVPKIGLYRAMYGMCDDIGIKIVDVFVHKIRKKLADANAAFGIDNVWGVGYQINGRVEFPSECTVAVDTVRRARRTIPKANSTRWSADDDAALREMFANGSEIWAIADDMERSERAILGRIRILGLRSREN